MKLSMPLSLYCSFVIRLLTIVKMRYTIELIGQSLIQTVECVKVEGCCVVSPEASAAYSIKQANKISTFSQIASS